MPVGRGNSPCERRGRLGLFEENDRLTSLDDQVAVVADDVVAASDQGLELRSAELIPQLTLQVRDGQLRKTIKQDSLDTRREFRDVHTIAPKRPGEVDEAEVPIVGDEDVGGVRIDIADPLREETRPSDLVAAQEKDGKMAAELRS